MIAPADIFDLREPHHAALVREMNRRKNERARGNCDFCGRPFDSLPLCEQRERHYRLGVPNCKGAHA